MRIITIITRVLLSICMLGYGCRGEHRDHINDQYITKRLAFDISKQTMLKSVDSISVKEVVKLGVDPDLPLGRIDRIVLAEDRIFVLDRTFSKFLFVYDKNGRLLYKIGNKGNGPGEYINTPKDFYVDEFLKEITVYNSETKTLNRYDWDGVLIDSRLLEKTWPYTFTKSDSIFYFAYKTVDSDSYLLRIQDEKENTYFKYKRLKNKRNVVADECFSKTSQYVYFVEDFNNDIVVLKDGRIVEILSIDFGENAIPKDFLTKYKGNKFEKEALSNTKATNISKIVETDELFSFQYMYEKLGFQIIYNKKNGNYLNGISLNTGYFPSEIYAEHNNYLVSALSAEYIESILPVRNEDPDAWEMIINSAHPVIKEIFLTAKEGVSDDYIFIYDINL